MLRPFLLLFLSGVLAAAAETTYTLTDYAQKPGEVIRILSNSSSKNGKMILRQGGTTREGALSVKRVRYLEQSLLGEGAETTFKVVNDTLETTNALSTSKARQSRIAALVGQTVYGFRGAERRWHLYLKGKTPDKVEAVELADLEAFVNHHWFPDHPVKIGESWPIEAGFFRHLVLRDLGNARTSGKATLKEVKDLDGRQTAILEVAIQSVGARGEQDAAPEATASLTVTGTLQVVLDTMLDHRLVLEGELTSTNRDGEDLTTAILPFRIEVTKTIGK